VGISHVATYSAFFHIHLLNFVWLKAADELMSMDMSFKACVFWAKAPVTAALGFLIIVPKALF